MAKDQMIQYIHPTNLTMFSYDGSEFKKLNKKENLYTISRVLYEDIVVYSFKIPKINLKDDISNIVEIKMYEEAGLDVNKFYKITYIVKELDFEEMSLIEAFAIELDTIKSAFDKCIKKVKYIDFLVLPFFAFTTFYVNKILTPKNDVFVYIGVDEAFLSFYKDGSYISTKSILNLSDIKQKLNAQDIDISLEKLKSILSEKGLNQELYEKNESELFIALESIFSDILTKINNVAIHNRSVFNFDRIDRIFFSTKEGRIKGFKEFLINFGFEQVDILDFNLFRDKKKSDFLGQIVASYGLDKYKKRSNKQNVSIFTKPPSFLSTQTGKLALSSIFFIAILFSVFIYFYIDTQNLQNQKNILEAKYQSIQKKAKAYKIEIRNQINQIKNIQKEIKKQNLIYENIKVSISKLESMKGKGNSYTSFLVSVNTLLQRYHLKANSIEQLGRSKMTIEVVSNYGNRDKIAKFIKSLISEGFVNVKTNEIKLDDKKYISKIEIEHE
ncbi:MAG: hypothetical protein GXP61_10140 [Epsilonproteobacteria bacterium]|nr:hypothetical protein [Campylobacterota bacterium]